MPPKKKRKADSSAKATTQEKVESTEDHAVARYKASLTQKKRKKKKGGIPPTPLHLWISTVTQSTKKLGLHSITKPEPDDETTDDTPEKIAIANQLTAADLREIADATGCQTKKNKKGMTAVHYALARNAPESVLERLLAVCSPDTLLVRDSYDRTPLHLAATLRCSFNVLKMILDAAGENATEMATAQDLNCRHCRQRWDGNFTPFHAYCHYRYRKEADDDRSYHLLIDAMMKGYDPKTPESHPLLIKDEEDRPPLQMAVRTAVGLPVIQKLVELCPQALRTHHLGKPYETPLYAACDQYAKVATRERIQLLVEAWPDALLQSHTLARSVLHQPLSEDILDYLLQVWPQGLDLCKGILQGNEGRPDYYDLLLSRKPELALEKEEGTGNTALHECAGSGCSGSEQPFVDSMQAILRHCPRAVKVQNSKGWTALHVSIRRRSSPQNPRGKLLLEAYPEAIYLTVSEPWSPNTNVREGKSSIVEYYLEGRWGREQLEPLLRLSSSNKNVASDAPLLQIVAAHAAAEPRAFARLVRHLHESQREEIESGLPFHVACAQSGCRLENLQVLLDLYPPALSTADEGGCFPFLIAALAGASLDVVFHLLRQKSECLGSAEA